MFNEKDKDVHNIWDNFTGPNEAYIDEQYMTFLRNPDDVDHSFRELFENYGKPTWLEAKHETIKDTSEVTHEKIKKITRAIEFIEAIRRYGHLEADIYPVGIREEGVSPLVDSETYGLTAQDLKSIPATWLREECPLHVENGLELIRYLKARYMGKISFEFDHVNDDAERRWLIQQIESQRLTFKRSDDKKRELLKRLSYVEGFEHFLNTTFVGQKRFSIEGLEMMIPILDHIINESITDNIGNIMMGMAHRGRLSVLAHVLGKPVDKIFSEFHKAPNKELIPSEGSMGINYGWSGDVKYHFGASTEVKEGNDTTRITLAHNPSHLEFVNPVVQGFTRAAQDRRKKHGYPSQNTQNAFSILIHGDAAFIGEGVVAETLNLSGLPGYKTGGTIHIIANNLIGYTTSEKEGRSTRYASDLAKGFEIPIIHVNADDAVACIQATNIAYKYRKKFKKDVMIDLVGYRRYGHNEMDEPRTTQPLLYQEIDQHQTVTEILANQLLEEDLIDSDQLSRYRRKREEELRSIYQTMKENETYEMEIGPLPKALEKKLGRYQTAVPLAHLKKWNKELLTRPTDFEAYHKIEKVLTRRARLIEREEPLDWGAAEMLTYASILTDGIPIRITGQDTERGTFAHRLMVLHDIHHNKKYCIMHGLEDVNATFDIRNSPLSETGVLGFEYGYSVQSPNTLVIWEAQFGDFANAAQVIIDQFISASRAKWAEISNMVLYLPHGYEGQGPEHSSARLERFLQMAAENNLIVANVTSSAQFFHLIRRQAALRGKEEARPLVLMTPKSLLRSKQVVSPIKEFTEGTFDLIKIANEYADEDRATRLIIGSGKVMVELEEEMNKNPEYYSWMQVIRLEQIYPFPIETLKAYLKKLPNIEEILWVQEEPRNMGAWEFVYDYLHELLQDGQMLRYIGRPTRSAPAVGEPNIHKTGQSHIIEVVLSKEKRSVLL